MATDLPEKIVVKKRDGVMTIEIKLTMFSYTDKETGMQITEIPSLDFSGYGDTQQEADEMLLNSVKEYFKKLCTYSSKYIKQELSNYGWTSEKFHTKIFKPNFNPVDKVEKSGILNYETTALSLTA